MTRKIKPLITLMLCLINLLSHSQALDRQDKVSYLSFQTGFLYDNYNSVGARTFFEYQKDLKKNWQYGISFEQSIHLFPGYTDGENNLTSNFSLLSYNYYYKINLYKDRVLWTSGLGLGGVCSYWERNKKFGVSMNLSSTLTVRINKKIYIETAPLFYLLPFNRVYYSPMNVSTYRYLFACTFLPIGFKVKL